MSTIFKLSQSPRLRPMLGVIGSAIGGIAGASSAQGDKERAEKAYQDALGATNYETQVAGQKGTEFDKMDPTSRDAMLRAMSDYESKARQGGLDAVARANLAHTTAAGQQAAQQSSAQIQNQAARAGRLQGPAAMIQQQVAAQQGAEMARMGGVDAAALAEQARMGALQGAVGTAGMVNTADARRAAAQDAINRFNVINSQANVDNSAKQADQKIGVNENRAGMYEGRAQRDVKEFGDVGKGVGAGIDSMIPGGAMGQFTKALGSWDPSKGGGPDDGSWGGFGVG